MVIAVNTQYQKFDSKSNKKYIIGPALMKLEQQPNTQYKRNTNEIVAELELILEALLIKLKTIIYLPSNIATSLFSFHELDLVKKISLLTNSQINMEYLPQ